MGTPEAIPCVLCTALARRWRDPSDRLKGGRIYRCAVCGGRYAVTGDALAALEGSAWDSAQLLETVRQCIAVGKLPRIEKVSGRPHVVAVGSQIS